MRHCRLRAGEPVRKWITGFGGYSNIDGPQAFYIYVTGNGCRKQKEI